MKKVLIVDDIEGWRNYNSEIVTEILNDEVSITTAKSATEAYNILLTKEDFDIIITDMQMEEDYSPKYAGEWLIEQIKTFKNYLNTKIIVISGAYNVHHIAELHQVNCIPKSTALKCISAYRELIK